MKKSHLLFALSVALITVSCSKSYNEDYAVGRNEAENEAKQRQQNIENALTGANKIISAKEQQRISAYIQRRGLSMTEYSGVFLQQTKKGNGKEITNDNTVTLKVKCQYLNEEVPDFFTKEKEQITFKVDGDTEVSFGLKTAVKKLSQGSKAIVIVPDNLAFWLDENGEKQEASATLVYEIEVLKVE